MDDFYYEQWKRTQMMNSGNIYHQVPTEPPKRAWMLQTLVVIIALGCLVYWGNGNHLAVEMPVVNTALLEQYQAELDLTRKQRDDYKKQAELTKKMLLASNTKIAQYEQRLKVLAESVPPQPMILEAVQKEAATEEGLRKLVTRNFGANIAKRVKVME